MLWSFGFAIYLPYVYLSKGCPHAVISIHPHINATVLTLTSCFCLLFIQPQDAHEADVPQGMEPMVVTLLDFAMTVILFVQALLCAIADLVRNVATAANQMMCWASPHLLGAMKWAGVATWGFLRGLPWRAMGRFVIRLCASLPTAPIRGPARAMTVLQLGLHAPLHHFQVRTSLSIGEPEGL